MDSDVITLKLRSLNEHLVCLLCAGYYFNPTAVTECLHTFCKSCIVRYLQTSKNCPTCGMMISETDPLSKLKFDRTMQDLMLKLIPKIIQDGRQKEAEFYEKMNRQKELESKYGINSKSNRKLHDLSNLSCSYDDDEQINLCLEMDSTSEKMIDGVEIKLLDYKFIRCSARSKIAQLKKLLKKFHEFPPSDYQIFLKCSGVLLQNDEHLKQIYVVHWKRKGQPMILHYGIWKIRKDTEVKPLRDCSDFCEKHQAGSVPESTKEAPIICNSSNTIQPSSSNHVHYTTSTLTQPSPSCQLETDIPTLSRRLNAAEILEKLRRVGRVQKCKLNNPTDSEFN